MEKIQTATELSESNENLVSVYLNANSCEYRQDIWNDNDNLTRALSLTTNSGNDYLSRQISNGRRHSSPTPVSDTTELHADDDGEEALFLPVNSEMSSSAVLAVSVVDDERACPLGLPVEGHTQHLSEHLYETS